MGLPPVHPAPPTEPSRAISTKLFVILVLAGALIIPALMITGLVRERESTRDQAQREISSKWGHPQKIAGPVLTLPYRRYDTDTAGRRINPQTRVLHILPERLDVQANVHPEIRSRGIYDAVLYRSELLLTGQFIRPNLAAFGIRPEDVIWADSYVTLGIPDMRGVRERIELDLQGRHLRFQPGAFDGTIVGTGVTALLDSGDIDTGRALTAFSIRLNLNGSGALTFVPLGRETSVSMRSSWPSPSFDGAFLPSDRVVTDSGFTAEWKVLDLNRSFPQVIRDGQPDFRDSEFGVRLMMPVDNYQQATRSVKYAALFILLTFLAFFLVEILGRLRVHPLQYLLVGCALVLFYLLLLSTSEYMAFSLSYIIAASATVLLVVLYSASVFRRASFAAVIGGVLSLLYGYLFVLLQLEDYSLLLGSVGLFVILGVVMYLTRRIDWYSLSGGSRLNGSPRPTTTPVPEPPAPGSSDTAEQPTA